MLYRFGTDDLPLPAVGDVGGNPPVVHNLPAIGNLGYADDIPVIGDLLSDA